MGNTANINDLWYSQYNRSSQRRSKYVQDCFVVSTAEFDHLYAYGTHFIYNSKHNGHKMEKVQV